MKRSELIALALAVLLVLASIMGAAWAAPQAAGQITFHEEAKVLGPEMRLNELADLAGRAAELADLPLGRSPEPGRTLILSRAELLGKLKAAAPLAGVEVSCPEEVCALRRSQVVSRAQMLAALQAQLEARLCAAGSGKVLVAGFRVAEEPLVPEGALELSFELPEAGERLLGSVNLALIIKVEGVAARKLRTSARVSLEREVVCAAREIRRHEVLSSSDLSLEVRQVSGFEAVTVLEEAVGKRAARRLEAGAALGRRDLDRPPVLSRGGSVTILLEAGPLTITARGLAAEAGRVGETVRVVNAESKREVLAVVVDGATVRVPFDR